ncbi:MAG: hypothetical protein D6812_07455 [Deltaproteobacteria bacterium]|nr:MAG: hypothetical protein D6812_07455 [Deltaproteobacteria bacterium]
MLSDEGKAVDPTAAAQSELVSLAQSFDPGLSFQGSKSGLTVFIFGDPGTWKTSFAACFPKPLFLSCATEGGDSSLDYIPKLYNRPIPPRKLISSTSEMVEYLGKIQAAVGKGAFPFKTIVIDSITYYTELWISEVVQVKDREIRKWIKSGKSGRSPYPEGPLMHQRDWGLLDGHIMKFLVPVLHNLGVNVVWTSLAQRVYETDERGNQRLAEIKPMIPGRSGKLLAGACKLIIYAEQASVYDPKTMRRQARPKYWVTPSSATPIVRHKFGSSFPSGRITCPYFGEDYSTYFGLEAVLGHEIVQ